MKHEYKKGHKGFKPKGAVSEKVKAWENLGEFITESGADRVKTILASCEPESKVESKIEGQLTLNVINPTDLDIINKL
jgi:hypothetical protein